MDIGAAKQPVSSELPPKDGDSDHGTDTSLDWTTEEETQLVRKVDLLVMPLLVLGFFALQLDRGNISNALTDFFLDDVGITQNQFNVGQQLLSAGIIILEIPSNIVLYRLGPTLWIGSQIVAWGLVATFQSFQKGLPAYLATRLLLGFGEAGFIPASLYTMTRWYKRTETSKRFSIFFLGNMLASALSGLIAFGILRMRGIAGLAGWQWLFLIEGIFSVLVGLAFLATFPKTTSNPTSLLRFRYFTEREARILTERVLRDDPSKAQVRRHISWKELNAVLTNWRLIPHIGLTITGISPTSALSSYAPTLVTGIGFDRLQSNALVSIGYWILLFALLFWGWAADKLRVRGLWVFFGLLLSLAFNIGNLSLIESDDAVRRFIVLTATIALSWPWHPVNGAWLSLNTKSAGERSITMAIHIMAANSSGLVGKQIFRSEDAPVYRRAWTQIVALSAASVGFSLLANLQYYLGNGRRLSRSGLPYQY